MANLNGTRQRYRRPAHGTNAVVTHSRRGAADTYLLLLQPRQDVAEALFAAATTFVDLEDGLFIRLTALENGKLRVDVVDANRGTRSIDAVAVTKEGAVLFATPRINATASSITLSSTHPSDAAAIANALSEAAYKTLDGYPVIFAATADDDRLQIEALGWERDAKTKAKARQVAKAADRRSVSDKLAASSAAIALAWGNGDES
jgi:hypothetical protein